MYSFDASSIIHAWDNYPIKKFPPLWQWIANQIACGQFKMSSIAFDEIKKKSPDCGEWLSNQEIVKIPLTNDCLHRALLIKDSLGIEDDNFHPKGVGENDILIIASAKLNNSILISEEGRQFNLPKEKAKYKIPAVCDLPTVSVRCIQFIDLIKDADAVFE